MISIFLLTVLEVIAIVFILTGGVSFAYHIISKISREQNFTEFDIISNWEEKKISSIHTNYIGELRNL